MCVRAMTAPFRGGTSCCPCATEGSSQPLAKGWPPTFSLFRQAGDPAGSGGWWWLYYLLWLAQSTYKQELELPWRTSRDRRGKWWAFPFCKGIWWVSPSCQTARPILVPPSQGNFGEKPELGHFSLNALLGLRRAFLTFFDSPASWLTDFFIMQTKSAWRAGLHPLNVGVGAMQIHVVLPGVQLLPSRFTFCGEGHWANPNPKNGDKDQHRHIPWPRGSFPTKSSWLGVAGNSISSGITRALSTS